MPLPDAKDWYAVARRLVGFAGFRDAPNDYNGDEQLHLADYVSEYDLLTNKLRDSGDEDRFLVVLDVDLPVIVVPSSRAGHHHLIIDKVLTEDQSAELLDVLSRLGIIEEGYAQASGRRGMTRVRTPWNLKPGGSIFNSTERLAERDRFHEQVEALDFPDEGQLKTDLQPTSETLNGLQRGWHTNTTGRSTDRPLQQPAVNPFRPEPGVTPGYPQER